MVHGNTSNKYMAHFVPLEKRFLKIQNHIFEVIRFQGRLIHLRVLNRDDKPLFTK
jgi:hypothetical protein